MAKAKTPSVVNRHIYSRASYLFQAAEYLAKCRNQRQAVVTKDESRNQTVSQPNVPDVAQLEQRASSNTARQMLAEVRSMTLKAQLRQSSSMKRATCKYCDSMLVEGQTCRSHIENHSKGGKKPWADVLVMECQICKNAKRFPISAVRQKRRHLRSTTSQPAVVEDNGKQDSVVLSEASAETASAG
jgi:ribonuclease P protein subunit RPR2